MDNSTIDNNLTLDSVQQQFEAWRINRTKREPIPESLWEAAVRLCDQHPITHVCRDLRISFADLKRRLSPFKQKPVRFMELDMSSFTGPWQIECERADGSKLRVSGSGQAPAVESLFRQFLS